jgi:hypothetical protein
MGATEEERVAQGEASARTQAAVEQDDSPEVAKRRIKRSWMLTAIGGPFAFLIGFSSVFDDPSRSSLAKMALAPLAGIGVAYLLWSAIWGVPAGLAWWRKNMEDHRLEGFAAVLFSLVPALLGYTWGAMGGAIYLYIKNLRVARGGSEGSR